MLDDDIVAAVERKSLADLAQLPRAALVVEDRYSNVFKLEHTSPGFVAELLATIQVRQPSIPIVFTETRPLVEEWTFRYLGAALAFAQAERQPGPAS